MPLVFRLAVLEAEDPQPVTKAARGSYGDIFRHLLLEGLRELGPRANGAQLQVSKWDVLKAQTYPSLYEFDGFLITGSTRNAFDDDAWILQLVDFTKTVFTSTQKPIIGICFGHQIVGRALGANVGRNPRGWELSVQRVDLNETGQRVLGVLFLDLHHFHHDIVFDVPPGVVNLGSSPACDVQGLYRPGRILTFQGHPELDSAITSEYLTSEAAAAALGPDEIRDALGLVDRPHSGPFVAMKMVEFLLAGGSEVAAF